MMFVAKKSCLTCNAPIDKGWYCDAHKQPTSQQRSRFADLKTDPELRKFYSNRKWTETSKSFLIDNPLCEECKKVKKYAASGVTHHVPDLSVLLSKGEDPYDRRWLHALCRNCHQKELRKKGNTK